MTLSVAALQNSMRYSHLPLDAALLGVTWRDSMKYVDEIDKSTAKKKAIGSKKVQSVRLTLRSEYF
jgi:hypothetical protein